MKRSLFVLFVVSLILIGCMPIQPIVDVSTTTVKTGTPTLTMVESNMLDSCVQGYDESIDYFPQKVTLTHTEGFSVEYHKHYKVITIKMPWSGASKGFQYALVQCGTPIPAGFADEQIIEVPIKNIVAMSTTQLPFLEKLALLDKLVGVDDTAYTSNLTVLKMAAENKLVMIGGGAAVNIEKVLELQPDLVMTYGSGSPEYDAHPKLIEAGIKVAINADWMDTSPLGRAEWGKYIALFFNREADSEVIFAETASKYEAMAQMTADVSERPTVFTGSAYQGTWYMPGGRSFVARFLHDAGANYLWSENQDTGSIPLAFEAVYDKAAEADFWLSVGNADSLKTLKAEDERYADFAALEAGNVWNNNKRLNANGGNDYYESAVAQPEVVLADLIKILHPDLLPDQELVYFQQLK